ncbi:MAG: sodium:solute symporter family protein, partial [Synergistota bacterium]|nr:sodium:solute symporter family protein [Synergistota bacterium]
GTWFVYRFLAWPTRLWQRKLGARTPAQMLSRASNSPALRVYLGLLSSVLLVVYASAVFKGAAIMLSGTTFLNVNTCLWILVGVVAISVSWGGLRGVLYTEALQGGIMVIGVLALLAALFKAIGGPIEGLTALAAQAPTPQADNGFLALSSGQGGLFIFSLVMVTSVGVWAQPHLVQRHFALKSARQARKVIPFAMLAIAVVVGGGYLAGALSRVILGPEIASVDMVIPALVNKLLSKAGGQLFALAIISASLSSASALLHIVAASLGNDVLNRPLEGRPWKVLVVLCAAASGVFAMKNSQIIAIICTTSWTLLASAILAPYIGLITMGDRIHKGVIWASSLTGLGAAVTWYLAGYASTAEGVLGISAPGIWGSLHPFFIAIPLSFMVLGLAMVPVFGGSLAREEQS